MPNDRSTERLLQRKQIALVYEERFPIPKIDNCHGQEGDIEDCAYFSTECWREAARKAVEEKERYG